MNQKLPRDVRYQMVGYLYAYHRMLISCRMVYHDTVPSHVRRPSPTAGCVPRGGENRPTERIAMAILTNRDITLNRRIVSVIDRLIRDSDEHTRRLIAMVYLIEPQRRKSLAAACDRLGISERAGYRIVTSFCYRMAVELRVLKAA